MIKENSEAIPTGCLKTTSLNHGNYFFTAHIGIELNSCMGNTFFALRHCDNVVVAQVFKLESRDNNSGPISFKLRTDTMYFIRVINFTKQTFRKMLSCKVSLSNGASNIHNKLSYKLSSRLSYLYKLISFHIMSFHCICGQLTKSQWFSCYSDSLQFYSKIGYAKMK